MTWTREDILLCRLLFYRDESNSDKSEYEYLTHCIQDSPDWDYVVKQSAIEFISPLIHYRLKKLGLETEIPAEISKTFGNFYLHNLKRNLSILGEAKRVFAEVKKSGFDFIVLKGLALAETVYPHFALRKMSDIDLLVGKEQVLDIDRCLSGLEYEAVDGRPDRAIDNPPGYLASLEYRRNHSRFLSFHIHWHPVNTSAPATLLVNRIDLARLWEKSVPARIADVDTHVLCPAHQVVFLCEHALRAGHSFDRLILMYDIHCILRSFSTPAFRQELIEETRLFGLSRPVYSGLSIVRRYGVSVPASVLAELKPRRLDIGEKFFLYLQFNNFRIRGSSLLVHLAMHRGLTAKIRFIYRIFFPPPAILLQKRYMKTERFRMRHHLSRLREIVSHLVSFLIDPTKKIT
jgi:hypothetical protein